MSTRNLGIGLASIRMRTWNDNIGIQVTFSVPQESLYFEPRSKIPCSNALCGNKNNQSWLIDIWR